MNATDTAPRASMFEYSVWCVVCIVFFSVAIRAFPLPLALHVLLPLPFGWLAGTLIFRVPKLWLRLLCGAGTVALCFALSIAGMAISDFNKPAPAAPKAPLDNPWRPHTSAALATAPAPVPAAVIPRDDTQRQARWDAAIAVWTRHNSAFMADPNRAAAMEAALAETERNTDNTLSDEQLIQVAQDLAFARTNWSPAGQ